MTEDQIERRVEALFDALDRRFLDHKNNMSQAQYDCEAALINKWSEEQYRTATKAA